MVKLLVRFLCILNILFCGFVSGQDIPKLDSGDLSEPELISFWVQENGEKVDKKRANEFFDDGVKEKKQQRWGPAVKSFGSSALHYPTPEVLNEYADVSLRSLGQLRAWKKEDKRQSDLSYIVSLYRSVLAANTVLKTMNLKEEVHVRHNIACITAYMDSAKLISDCTPLQIYGIHK